MSFVREIKNSVYNEKLTVVGYSDGSLRLNVVDVSPNPERPSAFATILLKKNHVKELIQNLNDWLLTLEQGGAKE